MFSGARVMGSQKKKKKWGFLRNLSVIFRQVMLKKKWGITRDPLNLICRKFNKVCTRF